MSDVQTLLVEQVMTPAPVCLDEDCSLAGALEFLVRERYQSAPVVDRAGALVGLISRGTLLGWLAQAACDRPRQTLEQVMGERVAPAVDRSPLTCAPTTTLREASRRLVREHAPAMLVVRGARLAGIVTLRDVVRAMGHDDGPLVAPEQGDVGGG